jgi:hypothetical protein
VRAEWYTWTGDLIAVSGRENRGIVIIVYEGNEGITGSSGGLHYGSCQSSHAHGGVELTTRWTVTVNPLHTASQAAEPVGNSAAVGLSLTVIPRPVLHPLSLLNNVIPSNSTTTFLRHVQIA